ncbi:hypothetical protein [Micromonospora eburnea]|uniref:Uncharacterized protein n=1 Tax=Micromonospora eburnea TaxID=227316 RepID=A0A1C6TQC2_9ACTN|nr:hypothetical protein [Micromonospora eburnea]SCL44024.1 hypothetical protein GA0070604_0150 [Micromonospora eburnea]
MSYRQLLDEAIGDPPASAIDIEQVIGRQRRKRRLRRWGVCGGAAVAVLGVAATVALVLPPAGRLPAPAGPPRITTVAGTPEDVARLDAAVAAAVTHQAPKVKWKDEISPGRPRWHHGGESGTELPNTIDHYFAQGGIAVDGNEAHLMVQIERFASRRTRMCPYTSPSYTCQDSVGPNGERIEVLTGGRTDQGSAGSIRTSSQDVRVVRPGDLLVSVTLISWSHLFDGALPLTVEQQTAIALDPAIALAPVPPGVAVTLPPVPSEAPSAPPSSPSPPSGRFDAAQQQRIDNAVFASLRRQVPGVKAVHGAGTTPADLASVWTDDGRGNTADEYWGKGRLLVDKATGLFSVQIWRTDPGFYGDLTCAKPTKVYKCTAGVGPHGEKYRTVTNTGGSAEREVNVRRADGSWLSVTLAGDGGKFPLTPAQQQAIAFDPAIALAPVK